MDTKFCYIDTETTGLDPERHAMVQLSCVMVEGGEEVGAFDSFIRPFEGAEIDEEALRVNGRTRAELAGFRDEREVMASFEQWLIGFIDKFDRNDKAFKVGYNIAFDDGFIRAWFKRCENNYLGSWFWNDTIDVRCICALRYAYSRSQLPNFKLETVARFALGSDHVDALADFNGGLHNAMADIRITRALLRQAWGKE